MRHANFTQPVNVVAEFIERTNHRSARMAKRRFRDNRVHQQHDFQIPPSGCIRCRLELFD